MRAETKKLIRPGRQLALGIICLVVLMMLGVNMALMQFGSRKAVQAASNKGSSFTFTAAGDYDQTPATDANLRYIGQSGANFHLGLGDFDYYHNPSVTADQWSSYVKGLLPDNYPFEFIPGDHDIGQLSTYATDLPDHIGTISGTYAEQYYFDYPPDAPLTRFMLFSPYVLTQYSYTRGGTGYNWVSATIDDARAHHIPWIVVGMFENCFSLGSVHCTNDDILNLLISKKVDLILYAHKHNYEASVQLAFNDTTCTSITTTVNPDCIADADSTMSKGVGSVVVITGTGGVSMLPIDPADPALGYFRAWEDPTHGHTWGVSQFTVSATQISMQFVGTSGGTYSDRFTIATGKVNPTPTLQGSPTASPSPSPTPTGTPTPGTGPLNMTWYFAEGRVGKGFREYLTIGNPTSSSCVVDVNYFYTLDGSSRPTNKTVEVTVAPASRTTESVNNDLGIPDSSTSAASLATIIAVDNETTPNCTGVVAERPLYFSNYHGISSGTDVIGGTALGTTYSFADIPTGVSGSSSFTSFLTILNPNAQATNVTVSYYANGEKMQSQMLTVPGDARGTISPGMVALPQHVAAIVSSDLPIMVERPTYFTNVNGVSGAYDVVGTPKAAADWLFAEGYTGPGYREDLTLANVDPTNAAQVTIILKSATGATNPTQLVVKPQSQVIWNVNAANSFNGATPEVSVEVTAASSGANIIVERELYFKYQHTLRQPAAGGTAVMGQVGPAAFSTYSFAEGYTNTGYNEWLTLQNPTGKAETIYATLVNGLGRSSTSSFTVKANSRFTVDVNSLVQQVFSPGMSSTGNAISMTVQTLDGSDFVAERPMYWNTSGISSFVTAGGSDVVGYVGG